MFRRMVERFETNQEIKKAFLIAIAFLMFFTLLPPNWHMVGDFNFHYEKAKDCEYSSTPETCNSYYPLLHFLGHNFSYSKIAFVNFLMLILIFLTPLALFFVTKKAFSVWLYFAATQYPYLIEGGAAYPQALAGIFLLLFLGTKNNFFRTIIFLIAMLAHSQAFYFVGFVWIVTLFFENLDKIKHGFWACGLLPTESLLNDKINLTIVNKNGLIPIGILIKDILNFFVRTFPFPFLIFSLWQSWKDKDWTTIFLTVFLIYAGIAVVPRVFGVIPLILLPALTRWYYSQSNPKIKKIFLILTIASFLFQIVTWANYKLNCL